VARPLPNRGWNILSLFFFVRHLEPLGHAFSISHLPQTVLQPTGKPHAFTPPCRICHCGRSPGSGAHVSPCSKKKVSAKLDIHCCLPELTAIFPQ
jgi:hypothetical protein